MNGVFYTGPLGGGVGGCPRVADVILIARGGGGDNIRA